MPVFTLFIQIKCLFCTPLCGFIFLLGEKASRKKQLCVKLVPRDSTKDAISELIILSRSKRPPSGYTMVG